MKIRDAQNERSAQIEVQNEQDTQVPTNTISWKKAVEYSERLNQAVPDTLPIDTVLSTKAKAKAEKKKLKEAKEERERIREQKKERIESLEERLINCDRPKKEAMELAKFMEYFEHRTDNEMKVTTEEEEKYFYIIEVLCPQN